MVMPPPTPTNTGTSDTLMMAWEITGWGVKGYTAMMASALMFLMMATSVEKARDLMRRPNTRMPLHSLTQVGHGQGVAAERSGVGGDLLCHRASFPPAARCRAQVVVHREIIPRNPPADNPKIPACFLAGRIYTGRKEAASERAAAEGEDEAWSGFPFWWGTSPSPTRRPSSTPPTPRCWGAPGWTGPSTPRRGRSCWRSAAPWAAARRGQAKLTRGYRLRAQVCAPHPGAHLAGRRPRGGGGAGLLLPQLPAAGGGPRHPDAGLLLHLHRGLRLSAAPGGHGGPAGHHGLPGGPPPAGAGADGVPHPNGRRRSTARPGTSGTRRTRASGCKQSRDRTWGFPAPAFVTLSFLLSLFLPFLYPF